MPLPVLAFTDPVGAAGTPWLVLGTSLGTSTRVLWEAALPVLARSHRVVAWDLPGHGSSPPAATGFSVADLADAVRAGASALGIEAFRYAGVSLGGAVGLELGLRHPAPVEALVIVASGAKLGTGEAWLDRAAFVRARSTDAIVAGSAERWFAPEGADADHAVRARLLRSLRDADDESYALCCEALAAYDVRDRLGAIVAPVLAVWGEYDAVAPEAAARAIADAVARGEAACIRGAAHLPPAERPDETAHAMTRFLAGV